MARKKEKKKKSKLRENIVTNTNIGNDQGDRQKIMRTDRGWHL